MNNDNNRQCLVTKFACYECGYLLNLTYDVPKRQRNNGKVDGDVTGAFKVENVICVKPCQHCAKPFEDVQNIIDELTRLTKKE